MRLASLLMVLTLAGCQSMPREEAVAPERVLSSPYLLRLDVVPKAARPGERVTVIAEFENIGGEKLWVPRRRELFLGYRQDDTSGESWSSSSDGILYVRLQPGQIVRYNLSFEVPSLYGQIEIYTSVRPDITVPLIVERWPLPQREANQALQPTPLTRRG